MKLRSGTKVPFLNKNLPKRKYNRAYEKPLPEETEDLLATSFANLSINENSNESAVRKQFESSTSITSEFSFSEIAGTDGMIELSETPKAFRQFPTRRSLAFENHDVEEICSFKKIQSSNFETLLNEYIEIFSKSSDEETIELTIEQNQKAPSQTNDHTNSTFRIVFDQSDEFDLNEEVTRGGNQEDSSLEMASGARNENLRYSSTPIQQQIGNVLSQLRKSISEI